MADGFFDPAPTPGANRHAPDNGCPRCEGNRLIQVGDNEHGAYARCPDCNPAPTTERQPVQGARWQDYDR